jgi:hypothetical protein
VKNEISQPPKLTAGKILDSIREQLRGKPDNDMDLLLRLFKDISDFDFSRMSPRDASRWMMREETARESSLVKLATQVGFRQGAKAGFIVGFFLCAFIAALIFYY